MRLQRSGQTDEARVHLKRFEYLTHNKISSAITLTYGEQGKYSVAQDVITNEPNVGPMIPVTFARAGVGQQGRTGAAGVCMLDVDGDGKLGHRFRWRTGDAAVQVFRNAR